MHVSDPATPAPGGSGVPRSRPPGLLLHAPGHYDLTVWLATYGRERAFRETILRLARLGPGETVLDVGCGTGTLAVAAARRTGSGGAVVGVDPSPEMLARARRKAARAASGATFEAGAAQDLPFEDGRFDLVLSTMMLHHLPGRLRGAALAEMARVMKPGGRLLVVDFVTPAAPRKGPFGRLHRHGHVKGENVLAGLAQAGLEVVESGPVGLRDLHFALAARPGARMPQADADRSQPVARPLVQLLLLAPVAALLLAAHLSAFKALSSRLALPAAVLVGVVVVALAQHLGLIGLAWRFVRRSRPDAR